MSPHLSSLTFFSLALIVSSSPAPSLLFLFPPSSILSLFPPSSTLTFLSLYSPHLLPYLPPLLFSLLSLSLTHTRTYHTRTRTHTHRNQRRATKQEALELDQEMESRLNAANAHLQIQVYTVTMLSPCCGLCAVSTYNSSIYSNVYIYYMALGFPGVWCI